MPSKKQNRNRNRRSRNAQRHAAKKAKAQESNRCSICEEQYKGYGNNAEPINSGRCCDTCNHKVIQARLARAGIGVFVKPKPKQVFHNPPLEPKEPDYPPIPSLYFRGGEYKESQVRLPCGRMVDSQLDLGNQPLAPHYISLEKLEGLNAGISSSSGFKKTIYIAPVSVKNLKERLRESQDTLFATKDNLSDRCYLLSMDELKKAYNVLNSCIAKTLAPPQALASLKRKYKTPFDLGEGMWLSGEQMGDIITGIYHGFRAFHTTDEDFIKGRDCMQCKILTSYKAIKMSR